MAYVKVKPFRGLCNQLGAICWAIGIAKARKLQGVWIDGMVGDAEDVRSPRISPSRFLDLEASSKALDLHLVEDLPPGATIGGDMGFTKRDRGNLGTYVALLVFAKPLISEAAMFIVAPYSAVHLRIEGDMLKHLQKVLQWKGNVMATLVSVYTKALEEVPKDHPLFVATNFGKTRRTRGRALPATTGFTTVQTPGPAGKDRGRDLRGAVDFLICVDAQMFIGAPFSSFSRAVSHVRKARGQQTIWIDV